MNETSVEKSTEKPASKGVDAAAPGSVGLDLVFENEKCEGGCDAPVVGHDSEGIPLCRECLAELMKDADADWILCSDRMPSLEDSNMWGEVWWWVPRFAQFGAQKDSWNMPEKATHWMKAPDDASDENQPAPPQNTAVTQPRQ